MAWRNKEEAMEENKGVNHWEDNAKFFEDGCPFCKSKEFLEGPHGGLSINFKCAKCGATFNDMWKFGIDLLQKPDKKLIAPITCPDCGEPLDNGKCLPCLVCTPEPPRYVEPKRITI
jgi:DNA-directed RNA polymerase subunit RPC12/RpoP